MNVFPYPHLDNDILWGLYSRHLRLADKVIVHSKKSAEYIKRKATLINDPIVIPHGCYLPNTFERYPDYVVYFFKAFIGHLFATGLFEIKSEIMDGPF